MTGSPAQAIFGQTQRQQSSRREALLTTTIREFDGGWNVIDNDLNLSSKFAKILENMYRSADGANTVRYGTKLFGDIAVQDITTGSLGTDPFFTTISSAVVRVTHAAHGFVSGHIVTLAGATGPVDGIPITELNAAHNVTVVTAGTYDITVTTTATAGGVNGGGTGVTFSHDNKTLASNIINMWYFQDRLIAVAANGNVLEIDSNGVSRIIFNTSIAAKLVGSPVAWSVTPFCSFAVFGGQLIVCNGIDKPLIVDFSPASPTQPVQYLVDIPSGSNVNTPTARYVLAMDHYMLMTGDPGDPGLVHISNFDTSGTWFGDAIPNDATSVRLDKVITSATSVTIRGISRHRERVVVAFDDALVLGDLNIFNTDGDHTPDFTDVIEQHGSISHRALQPLGNDLLMNDLIGVPSLARALFTGSIRPDRVSELIDPEIQKALLGLSVGSTEDRVFAIYNQVEGQYMLFIPNNDVIGSTTETLCFVYTAVSSIKLKAWSLFKGWNFSCATRSALNRVFFAATTKVYVYGARVDKFYGDFIDDPAVPIPAEGVPVNFIWELPWADFDKRMHVKKTRYIGFDTTGTAQFTAKMFVDNIYEDKENPGSLLPTLEVQFVGGDSAGYGGGGFGGDPYGGGRRTSDERLWAWPAKCKIAKMRLEGSSVKALAFVAVTLAYQEGSVRR